MRSFISNLVGKKNGPNHPMLTKPIPIPMPPTPAVLGKWSANANGILPTDPRFRWDETWRWINGLPKPREHMLMELGVGLIFPSFMLRHFAYTTRWYESPMDWLIYGRGLYAFLQQPDRLRSYLYGATISLVKRTELVELSSSKLFIGQQDTWNYIDSLECPITRALLDAALSYALPFLRDDPEYQTRYPSNPLDLYLFIVAASDLLWRIDKIQQIIDGEVNSLENFGFFKSQIDNQYSITAKSCLDKLEQACFDKSLIHRLN
ncbi:hypothetical protein [Herpetosiphon gulosus]|uniref:Uncharacterized protein n=1 Tax=Herpetosiphon gulosus TaxID=1973496 RepID=A0ABP9X4B2_9CHLR